MSLYYKFVVYQAIKKWQKLSKVRKEGVHFGRKVTNLGHSDAEVVRISNCYKLRLTRDATSLLSNATLLLCDKLENSSKEVV